MHPIVDAVRAFFTPLWGRQPAVPLFQTREQEHLFRQIAENVDDVIWMTDTAKDRMVYISPSYEKVWGLSRQSLYDRPKSWVEAIHEEDRARVWEAALTRQKTGTYDIVYRIVRPDGCVRWVHDRAFPIRDAQGRVYRVVGMARDVTEGRAAERSLKRLAAIVETSNDGILLVSPELIIQEWNKGAERLFGYTAEEAVGRHLSILHPGDRRAELEQGVEALLRGQSCFIETVRKRKDGRLVHVHLSGSIIQEEDGRVVGYCGTYRDISDRKQAEEARVLREREQVQRDLVAVLSHDLRTPIAAIKGFAETLRSGALEDPRHRLSFVRTIERHADKLAKLVDNMLTLSVLECGRRASEPEVIGLGAFITDYAAGLEPLLKRRQLDLILKLEALTILADGGQLSQVFQNLIDNAVKFTPQQGRIVIETRRDERRAVVSIRDSGIGVPAAELERIFDRYHRVASHRHVKGTGLGLFIVKQIVEAQGGKIWAESQEGRGAAFHFTLPLARAS